MLANTEELEFKRSSLSSFTALHSPSLQARRKNPWNHLKPFRRVLVHPSSSNLWLSCSLLSSRFLFVSLPFSSPPSSLFYFLSPQILLCFPSFFSPVSQFTPQKITLYFPALSAASLQISYRPPAFSVHSFIFLFLCRLDSSSISDDWPLLSYLHGFLIKHVFTNNISYIQNFLVEYLLLFSNNVTVILLYVLLLWH